MFVQHSISESQVQIQQDISSAAGDQSSSDFDIEISIIPLIPILDRPFDWHSSTTIGIGSYLTRCYFIGIVSHCGVTVIPFLILGFLFFNSASLKSSFV